LLTAPPGAVQCIKLAVGSALLADLAGWNFFRLALPRQLRITAWELFKCETFIRPWRPSTALSGTVVEIRVENS
jgi:hypothetical protein